MTFDLSGLVPAERDVIGWAVLGFDPESGCGREFADKSLLLALTPIEKRPSREAAIQRLATATKRRLAILELREGYYRVDPEALGKYLESKKRKKETTNA